VTAGTAARADIRTACRELRLARASSNFSDFLPAWTLIALPRSPPPQGAHGPASTASTKACGGDQDRCDRKPIQPWLALRARRGRRVSPKAQGRGLRPAGIGQRGQALAVTPIRPAHSLREAAAPIAAQRSRIQSSRLGISGSTRFKPAQLACGLWRAFQQFGSRRRVSSSRSSSGQAVGLLQPTAASQQKP